MQPSSIQTKSEVLASWMIVLSLLAMWAGAGDILKRWSILAFGAQACAAIFFASGLLLFIAGVWLLVTAGRQRTAAVLGAMGAGIFAGTIFAGVWSGAIPCSGPG